MKKTFLWVGLMLSVISKILQLTIDNIIGDILILIAAPFLILSIFFHIPKYTQQFHNTNTKSDAIKCAFFTCLTILFFQLFTMIYFGWRNNIGFLFILPFLISSAITIMLIVKLYKTQK